MTEHTTEQQPTESVAGFPPGDRVIATPNPNFSLETAGVKFHNGLGGCDPEMARLLVRNHGYRDVTEILILNPDVRDGLALKAGIEQGTLAMPPDDVSAADVLAGLDWSGTPTAETPADPATPKRAAKKKAAKKKATRPRRATKRS